MAGNTTSPAPFGLRPWPHGDKKPKDLGEFITRVNVERNGFRNVTEDSLREEIAAQETQGGAPEQNGKDEDEDADKDGDAGDEGGGEARDIRTVREGMLRDVEVAHQTAMITLDFISLLLSKEHPVQASSTLSALARGSVGIGTLGATVLGASALSQQKRQDNTLVATGRKLLDINKTVDAVLSAATRLQTEVGLETRYWAEVLAVSESGWSVLRLPGDRHSLGVKFGFSEAAPAFRNSSVAPMRRADDGSVILDCGRVGGPSQRVVVTMERDGRVVGRSHAPHEPLPDDAPLQSRVREARDSAFAQELWQEINREGRSMRSYNVQLEDDSVLYNNPADSIAVRFRLVSLQEQAIKQEGEVGPAAADQHTEDDLAEALSACLNLLLGHAHRLNNRTRMQPNAATPPATGQRTSAPYALLRPIIAYLTHEASVRKATAFASNLVSVLRSAGISTATFQLGETPVVLAQAQTSPPPRPGEPPFSSASESFMASLLTHLDFSLELHLTPSSRLSLHGRTFLFPFMATRFQVHLLPPTDTDVDAPDAPDAAAALARNPLAVHCPPAETYPDLGEVVYYVREAASRALAAEMDARAREWLGRLSNDGQRAAAEEGEPTWSLSLDGAGLQCSAGGGRVDFDVRPAGAAEASEAAGWDGAEPEPGDGGVVSREGNDASVLHVGGSWRVEDQKDVRRSWAWTGQEHTGGDDRPWLEEVVRSVVEGRASHGAS